MLGDIEIRGVRDVRTAACARLPVKCARAYVQAVDSGHGQEIPFARRLLKCTPFSHLRAFAFHAMPWRPPPNSQQSALHHESITVAPGGGGDTITCGAATY